MSVLREDSDIHRTSYPSVMQKFFFRESCPRFEHMKRFLKNSVEVIQLEGYPCRNSFKIDGDLAIVALLFKTVIIRINLPLVHSQRMFRVLRPDSDPPGEVKSWIL